MRQQHPASLAQAALGANTLVKLQIWLFFEKKMTSDLQNQTLTVTLPTILFHLKINEMNKGDLVQKIAEHAGLTKAQSEEALNAVIASITEALKNDDSVTLVGFGTFSVSKRDARTGRNPQTGETITIEAKNQVKFKVGKKLADAVN